MDRYIFRALCTMRLIFKSFCNGKRSRKTSKADETYLSEVK